MRRRIVLVGFGNVGREFARLLLERRSELARAFGLDASVVAIPTARHGSVENPRGIDLRKALRLADAGVSLESCGRGISRPAPEYIRHARADIVLELTPLRIGPRQVAVERAPAARRIGLLETDPSMDLDGWDATVKACLLANVLMGGRLRPERVPRQGISTMPADAVRAAGAEGKRMKQVARGWRQGRAVRASVSLEAIGSDHPMFSVNGTSSAVAVRTDMLKQFQLVERNPGLRQTACAVYSDLIAIHECRLSQ